MPRSLVLHRGQAERGVAAFRRGAACLRLRLSASVAARASLPILSPRPSNGRSPVRWRPHPRERRARLALAAMVSLACCVGVGFVSAAALPVRTSFPTEQGKPFKAPRQLVSKDGVLRARFVADETAVHVGGRRVIGRAYNDSFPGPTLRLSQGDTLRLTLVNRLRAATNMHFHGMHVSPAGRSDNVLRTVAP